MRQEINGKGPQLGPGVFVAPSAFVIGDVIIGASSSIWFGAVLRAEYNSIVVGKRSNLQDQVVVHCDPPDRGGSPVVIGENVTVGHGALLHGCTIGDGALVGMRSTVLDGATLGARSLLAAGSLVPPGMTIPEGVLATGSPARIKRDLREDELANLIQSAADYVETARLYLSSSLGKS